MMQSVRGLRPFTRVGIGGRALFLKRVFIERFGRYLCLFWLALLAHPARAQLPATGTDATFDVATWNIEWFGSTSQNPSDDALQFANVLRVIRAADVDLWAVQEMADRATFRRLVDSLGTGYEGQLATNSGTQRIGFIYRTDVVQPRGAAFHILEQFESDFAFRPPLQLDARVSLPDTTFDLSLITLHMKCCGGSDDYARRQQAAVRLKNRLDFLLSGAPVIVLGDFNDELTGSIAGNRPSPFENFLADAAAYAFVTEPLETRDAYTYCEGGTCTAGSNLDHILITNELFDVLVEEAERYDAVLSGIESFVRRTSDHLPVVARFRPVRGTAVEAAEVIENPLLDAPYPNPFQHRTAITYVLKREGPMRLEVFDGLGRRVAVLAEGFQGAGLHHAVFEATALQAGLYFIQLTAAGHRRTHPVVHLP